MVRSGDRRTLRRGSAGATAHPRRSSGRQPASHGPQDETIGGEPLDGAIGRPGDRPVEEHRGAHVRLVRRSAASLQELPAFHRSAVRRQGQGHRRPLPESPITPSCCASTRRARSRRWNARSRYCRSGSAILRASPTITFDTARRPCSQPLISPMAGSSRSVARGIAIRSSWASSSISTPMCRRRSMRISSSIITPRQHPKVRAWLAARPRFHLHFTPTYASWLNQVERWFALLSQRQIRRGSFVSAKDLVAKIEAFVDAYNARSTPFIWTATSEAILEKVGKILNLFVGRNTSGFFHVRCWLDPSVPAAARPGLEVGDEPPMLLAGQRLSAMEGRPSVGRQSTRRPQWLRRAQRPSRRPDGPAP